MALLHQKAADHGSKTSRIPRTANIGEIPLDFLADAEVNGCFSPVSKKLKAERL